MSIKALILVDLQYDFGPGGAMAVPDANLILPVINRVQEKFELVVSAQDWHPKNHCSFAANHAGKKVGDLIDLKGMKQVLKPVHCLQQMRGSEPMAGLHIRKVGRFFQKGIEPAIDDYSAFFDFDRRRATGLREYLHERGVKQVYVMGLKTEECVKFTALDARSFGLDAFIIEDGCRGAGDSAAAVQEMKFAGVNVVRSTMI